MLLAAVCRCSAVIQIKPMTESSGWQLDRGSPACRYFVGGAQGSEGTLITVLSHPQRCRLSAPFVACVFGFHLGVVDGINVPLSSLLPGCISHENSVCAVAWGCSTIQSTPRSLIRNG